jgi:hypothetical protein
MSCDTFKVYGIRYDMFKVNIFPATIPYVHTSVTKKDIHP